MAYALLRHLGRPGRRLHCRGTSQLMISRRRTQRIAQQVGQLLIVGFEGTSAGSALESLLARWHPAGVILFARNIDSAEQTFQLLKDCQARVPTRLFTCVDMEGGSVDRFRRILGNTASAAEVFATGQRQLFRRHGKVIGESCRTLGFNTDFAPVVDLAFVASREVLRSRAVSEDARQVVVYAREFLSGLGSLGVIGSAKHFPGLGEAGLDTHQDLPRVEKSWKKLWQEDIYPYRALSRKLDMVLVGHASYPSVTPAGLPASLSKKWITGILRNRVGYRGLVVSDDLEMGGVLKAAPIERAAVEHVRAGGDLCLICRVEENIARAYEAMILEAERDPKFARRVAASSRRVLAFKHRSRQLRADPPSPTATKVAEAMRAVAEFNETVRRAQNGRAPGASRERS